MIGQLSESMRARPWPWILYGVGLAVRLIYVFQGHLVPPQDTPDYDEIALNLLSGEGFVARTNWFGFELYSWRPPFYPFFLALVYGVWGYSHQAVKVVQAVVGAGIPVLVYLLGCRLRRARAALIAGWLTVVYGPLVAVCNEVMTETWFTFWTVLAVWALVDSLAGETDRWRLVLGGAAVGLAALTRPVGLLFLPAFGAAVLWRRRREGVQPLLWVSLALCCCILPWSVRNYRIHGSWVPISTHGGFILARSNAADPAWRQEHGWGIEESFFQRFPSEIERDRYWYRQGMSFIRAHPVSYLRLAGERFLRFWYFLRPDYNFWFMLILPFFLAGLWTYWREGGFLFLSSAIGVSLAVFCFVLYGSTRFRLPFEPLFGLFGATFIEERWRLWGGRRMLGLLVGALVVNLLFDGYDEQLRQLVVELLGRWGLK